MSVLLAAGVFVLMNALLASGAWRAAGRLLPGAGSGERLLAAGVIASAQVVITEAALGAAGALRIGPLLAVNAAVSLALLRVGRRSGFAAPGYRFSLAERFLLAAAGGMVGFVVLDALRYPPTEYDSLAYLLPQSVEWMKTASIAPIEGLNLLVRYYPGNASLLYLWLLLPLRNDAVVQLTQVIYLALAAAAAAVLALRLGSRPRLAWMAGAGLLLTPQALDQASSNKNDILALFFLLACLAFSVGHNKEGGKARLYLAAASLGLFLGTRYASVAYLPVALFGMVLCAAPRWRANRAPVGIAAALGLVAVCGGFWYIRNWAMTGNPVFPGGLARGGVGGMNIAGSWTLQSQGRLVDDMSVLPGNWGEYLVALGPGGVIALLLAPLYLAWIPARGRGFGATWWHTGWLPISFFVLFLVTPHSAENLPLSVRYAFPALAMCWISLACLASRLRGAERFAAALGASFLLASIYFALLTRLSPLAAGVAAYWRAAERFAAVLLAAVVLAALWGSLAGFVRTLLLGRRRAALVAGCAFAAMAVAAVSTWRERTEFHHYAAARGTFGEKGRAFAWLASRGPAQVWWAGDDRIYPLYGPGYRNAVSPVPPRLEEAAAALPIYIFLSVYPREFQEAGGFPPWPALAADLRDSLRFRLVFSTRDARIYRERLLAQVD